MRLMTIDNAHNSAVRDTIPRGTRPLPISVHLNPDNQYEVVYGRRVVSEHPGLYEAIQEALGLAGWRLTGRECLHPSLR